MPDDILPLETGYAVLQLKEKTPASKEAVGEGPRVLRQRHAQREAERRARSAYIERLRTQVVGEPKFPEASSSSSPSRARATERATPRTTIS